MMRRFFSKLVLLIGLAMVVAVKASPLAEDDFESGLDQWRLEPADRTVIVEEPGTGNRVLELTPERYEFTQVLLDRRFQNVRMEGRFLFPTEGDGYLGFIYNHVQGVERTDSGVIYVKSNGSYIRISPHFDGNPSWRLHEEYRVDLEDERRIQTGVWFPFRLDVRGFEASLAIGDLDSPLVQFVGAPTAAGALGLEARPGGGEPVWVDDITISAIDGPKHPEPATGPSQWEFLGPFEVVESDDRSAPELPETGWKALSRDFRGALITGVHTQYRSGERRWLYLRHRFTVNEGDQAPTWLSASSANRLDVWLNGFYRGSVAEERFIWSDFERSLENPGARLPLAPRTGDNEIVIRVHGRRFAGGGMFLALGRPDIP